MNLNLLYTVLLLQSVVTMAMAGIAEVSSSIKLNVILINLEHGFIIFNSVLLLVRFVLLLVTISSVEIHSVPVYRKRNVFSLRIFIESTVR
jgi:hypothetical protein